MDVGTHLRNSHHFIVCYHTASHFPASFPASILLLISLAIIQRAIMMGSAHPISCRRVG
jgi:hypothetical protein